MSTKKPHKPLCLDDFMKRKRLNGANSSNSVFVSTSTSVDPSIVREKGKERSVIKNASLESLNDSVAYPTRCRFCGGMLRVIDKHREDRKLTLQCRRRKCIKFNGLTADKQAKHILSEMAKPKIDYGWYLSDPVRHSYGIFAGDSDSSDSEIDRSNVDVRPIIQDGNIMLRVFGQKRLVRLL